MLVFDNFPLEWDTKGNVYIKVRDYYFCSVNESNYFWTILFGSYKPCSFTMILRNS